MKQKFFLSNVIWICALAAAYFVTQRASLWWIFLSVMTLQLVLSVFYVRQMNQLARALESLKILGQKAFLVGRDNIIFSRKIYDSGEELQVQSQKNSISVSEVSSEIENNTLRFQQTVEESDKAMALTSKAKDKMEESLQRVTQLRNLSQEITQFSELIDEISFQTNLLSLNASVEAARAGEAGRGFSVVAEAVRQLAHKSSQASTEVKKKVDQILSEVERTSSEIGELRVVIDSVVHSFEGVKGQIDVSKEVALVQTQELNSLVRSFQQIDQIAVVNKDQTDLILNESLKSVSLSETLSELLVRIDTALLGAKEVGRRRTIARRSQAKNASYDEVFEAHLSWKGRLRLFALGLNEEGFKSHEVANGEFCRFGKWMSSHKDLVPAALWEKTQESHLRFHKCASQIVELVQSGKKQLALQILDQHDGEFMLSSQEFFRRAALISDVLKKSQKKSG